MAHIPNPKNIRENRAASDVEDPELLELRSREEELNEELDEEPDPPDPLLLEEDEPPE